MALGEVAGDSDRPDPSDVVHLESQETADEASIGFSS
jgi:hypothetical protein